MIGLFLDSFVLYVLMLLFNRDEAMEHGKLFFAAFGINIVNFLLALGLGRVIGIWALVPMFAVVWFTLIYFFHLLPKNAITATLLFMSYKVAFVLALS